MALADPQSITLTAGAVSLPRVSTSGNSSTYTSADGLLSLTLSHQYGKRTRRVIRADLSKITADPFIPAQNTKVSMSCYMVVDVPPAGFSAAEVKDLYEGLTALLGASSDAVAVKLFGGES